MTRVSSQSSAAGHERPRNSPAALTELAFGEHSLPQVLQRNTDLLMLPPEYCNLDEAPIAVVPGSTAASAMPLTPKILAAYLDAAFFASSDDRELRQLRHPAARPAGRQHQSPRSPRSKIRMPRTHKPSRPRSRRIAG